MNDILKQRLVGALILVALGVVWVWLGLEGKGGMVRIGAAFYNTLGEIHRLGDALRTLV